MKIDKKLKKVFDFQRFEQNERLGKLISEAADDAVELSDGDLSQVNAAGDPSSGGGIYNRENPDLIRKQGTPDGGQQ